MTVSRGSGFRSSSRPRRSLRLRPPSPSPAPSPPETQPPDGRSRWSKKAIAIGAAIALAVLGGAAGTAFSLWVAPEQQVRQQEGLDTAQATSDANSPAILIKNARYGGVVRSGTTSRTLEPTDFTQDFGAIAAGSGDVDSNLIPPGSENVPPGALEYGIDPNHAQPRVYDTVVVTLVGNHYRPTKVTDMSIRVLSRATPPGGTVVYAHPEGGIPTERIGYDLDSTDLAARVTKPDIAEPQETSQHYFDNRQITIARQESVDLQLAVFTSKCLCQFVFTLRTDDGGSYMIDNNGKSWQISSFAPSYTRAYAFNFTTMRVDPCGWPNECETKH